MRGIISRFAPAPTGFLHLGHVVSALEVWRETRARSSTGSGQAAKVLLRIEDHDRRRSRPEYERAIFEDLSWLGFAADEPPVRQSDRGAIYQAALATLRRQGLVYACDCSRSTVYPGTCRERGVAEGPGAGLRVRLDPSVERFTDLRLGPQEQRPAEQCGDLLIRDRDGHWTYQFAATVDDFVQGVTLVIRGVDLLDSTGRQIQLARLLGRAEPPAFLHHALIMKSATQKLSKSDGDTAVRELRARGWTREQVIEAALAAVAAA